MSKCAFHLAMQNVGGAVGGGVDQFCEMGRSVRMSPPSEAGRPHPPLPVSCDSEQSGDGVGGYPFLEIGVWRREGSVGRKSRKEGDSWDEERE